MKNSITFTVELDFDGEVKESHYKEIAQNVLDSLINHVDSGPGLAPEESGYVTQHIHIREWFNGIKPLVHSF